MSANLFLEYLFQAVWIVAGFIALIGLFVAVKVIQKKLAWGAAKYMGITKKVFFLMNVIY